MTSFWRLGVLWLHLVAAMVWLGGIIFQSCVLCPMLGSPAVSRDWVRLALRLETRFRTVMWPAIGLALFTGLVNLLHTWYGMTTIGMQVSSTFAWVLGGKLLLITAMLGLQAVQQFVLQPRRLLALQERRMAGEEMPEGFARLQRWAALLYSLVALLGLGVLLCGVLLRAV